MKLLSTISLGIALVLISFVSPSFADEKNRVVLAEQYYKVNVKENLSCGYDLYVQGDTFVLYSCTHECFDSLITAKYNEIDWGATKVKAHASRGRGYSGFSLSCKNNKNCFKERYGEVGRGTRSCRSGDENTESTINKIGHDSMPEKHAIRMVQILKGIKK